MHQVNRGLGARLDAEAEERSASARLPQREVGGMKGDAGRWGERSRDLSRGDGEDTSKNLTCLMRAADNRVHAWTKTRIHRTFAETCQV